MSLKCFESFEVSLEPEELTAAGSTLDMFPSAAFMPPCAATVCERVGKSFVMHLYAPSKALSKMHGMKRISTHFALKPVAHKHLRRSVEVVF